MSEKMPISDTFLSCPEGPLSRKEVCLNELELHSFSSPVFVLFSIKFLLKGIVVL